MTPVGPWINVHVFIHNHVAPKQASGSNLSMQVPPQTLGYAHEGRLLFTLAMGHRSVNCSSMKDWLSIEVRNWMKQDEINWL